MKGISELVYTLGDIKTTEKGVTQAGCVMVPGMPWRVSCVKQNGTGGRKVKKHERSE